MKIVNTVGFELREVEISGNVQALMCRRKDVFIVIFVPQLGTVDRGAAVHVHPCFTVVGPVSSIAVGQWGWTEWWNGGRGREQRGGGGDWWGDDVRWH